MLNKALAGQSVTISVLGGSGIPLFFPSFHKHPKLNIRMTPPSVSMPRCRGRRYIHHLLPIPLLPVVEHRLSAPSYRTNKWRPATHEFGLLWYCSSHHLPDQTDLVIIELDTEDEPCVSSFLSFLFRLFRTTRFLFASVRYRSVATALRPFYTRRSIVTPQMTDFTTPTRVDAHEAHPARLLIYRLSSAMASSWLYPFHIFHSAMTINLPHSPSSS